MSQFIPRRIARLAWPVLVAQVAVVGSGVIDTLMAGRLSALDLAAVGVSASIYITVFMTAMGVLTALTPVVAQHYGAGRHAEIGDDVRQSAWLALVLALAGMALLRHPEPFILLAQLTPAMEVKVRAYLSAISWGIAPGLAFRLFYGLMSGIGQPRAIMGFNLIGLAAKVPLNLFYMYGLELGSTGCGASTATISWLSALLAWTWFSRRREYARYAVLSRLTFPRPAAMLELMRIGLPIGLTLLVDVTAFTFMALFIARLGPTMSAAHQVASNLAVLVFMIPLSIGQASLVVVGHALGAGDTSTARRAGMAGISLGATVSLAMCVILWLAAVPIAALYTPDPEVRQVASGLIGIVAIYHLADALQTVVVNVLRGYKRTVVPMFIYVISLWGVGLGGGYLVGLTDFFGPPQGAAGFWLAAATSLFLAGAMILTYFLRIARTELVRK